MIKNKLAPEKRKVFLLPNGPTLKVVQCSNILYAKARGNHCEIILDDNSVYDLCKTLDAVEKTLKSIDFLRVHKSYLVNLTKIDEIERNKFTLTLSNKCIIPISRRKRKEFIRTYIELQKETVQSEVVPLTHQPQP